MIKIKDKNIHTTNIFKNIEKIDIIINRRYVILIFIVIFTMLLLILNLYFIQVENQSKYSEKLVLYNARKQTITPPRGEILSNDNRVLVGNTQIINITYFPLKNITNTKEWELAFKFSSEFNIDIDNVTKRDLKDLYIHTQTTSFDYFIKSNNIQEYFNLINEELSLSFKELITKEEYQMYYDGLITDKELYDLRLDRIDKEIDMFDDKLIKAWVIHQSMNQASGGRPKQILSDISIEEVSKFTEISSIFPGFDIEIDWERYYPNENGLNSVLGNVTTSKQGLPHDNLDYYLALDYEMNEKVGISGLEKEYEEILNGTKAILDIKYNDKGEGTFIKETEGEKGHDILTTIDLDLQVYTESLLEKILKSYENDKLRLYLNTINVIVSNPKTGDILTLANITKTKDGQYYNDPSVNFTSAYEPGSIVKGASLYMGIDQGIMKPNELIYDEPIKLKSTPIKGSWMNLGLINDTQALARSSNVYMYYIAMRLSGNNYYYDGPLIVKPNTFDIMRNYYARFGLGVKTGIDIPNENLGYFGISNYGGLILDYIIGQYDTYTNIQLSQYVNTIANNGVKVKPRLVSKAFSSGTNNVVYENEIDVLDTLDNQTAIDRVKLGFYECVNSINGICYGFDQDIKNNVAAKTGTAEALAHDEELGYVKSPHNSVIAFTPYDDPELTISCIAPNAWNGDKTQPNICLEISNKIIKAHNTKSYNLE